MNPLMVCLMSLLIFVQAGVAQQAAVAGQVRLYGRLAGGWSTGAVV